MNGTVVSTKSTPKDVFLYLGLMLTLYVGLSSLTAILFQYIDMWVGEIGSGYYGLDTLRWLVAVQTVVFPTFVVVSWLIRKDLSRNAQNEELRVRKWFLYLTLFLAVAITLGDLISLIYHFLDGDFATQFLLKSLTVLVLGLLVCDYYLLDLKSKLVGKAKFFATLASVIVLASVGTGFYLVGSPVYQRNKKADEKLTLDLQTLERDVLRYKTDKGSLPVKIEDLKETSYLDLSDPTIKSFEYRVLSPTKFELCANFKTATSKDDRLKGYGFDHEAGRFCFTRTANDK